MKISRPRRASSSRNRLRAATLAVTAAALSVVSDARAEDKADVELRHDLAVDIPVTIGLGGGLLAYTLLLRDDVVPSTCTWCDGARPGGVNGFDSFFRDALVRRDTGPATITSHVVAYGAGPLATAALLSVAGADEGRSKNAPTDVLLMAEATLAALSLGEVVKGAASRERPNVHAEPDEARHAEIAAQVGANASFPSGHTLAVFAMTGSAGMIATMRGYRLAPLIWIAGSVLGVTAAYLRVAADQHYVTDTLAGAALGVAVGAGVPWLFHRPRKEPSLLDRASISTQPVLSGRVVSVSLAF